jgi:hypothetical protein
MHIHDIRIRKRSADITAAFFFHPDFTVGFGLAPNQPPKRVADYTAGRESHPTPKKYIFFYRF